MRPPARIVGSVLVRNEDAFVEQAVRNVVAFCDRIHVLDHVSTDRTSEILRELAREFDHLTVRRSRNSADSHGQLQPYVGTRTWVVGVDGDELYDPTGLARLRHDLRGGAYGDLFFVKAHVLNCDELDRSAGLAHGFMAPPCRPVTKLFNFEAITAWERCPQRLYGEAPVFRPGFGMERKIDLSDAMDWTDDPLRLLHMCFLRRSSVDSPDAVDGRLSLAEGASYHRGLAGWFRRLAGRQRRNPKIEAVHAQGLSWKQEWYRRGPRVTVDATPFFGPGALSAAGALPSRSQPTFSLKSDR